LRPTNPLPPFYTILNPVATVFDIFRLKHTLLASGTGFPVITSFFVAKFTLLKLCVTSVFYADEVESFRVFVNVILKRFAFLIVGS
jgi:hypothetical protein